MKAYKGFNRELRCKGFQYEVGKEYEEPEAELCKCGFHACEDPLDVFCYDPPASSRYCEVEMDEVDPRNWQMIVSGAVRRFALVRKSDLKGSSMGA